MKLILQVTQLKTTLSPREDVNEGASPMQLIEMHPWDLFLLIWTGAGWFPSAGKRAVFSSQSEMPGIRCSVYWGRLREGKAKGHSWTAWWGASAVPKFAGPLGSSRRGVEARWLRRHPHRSAPLCLPARIPPVPPHLFSWSDAYPPSLKMKKWEPAKAFWRMASAGPWGSPVAGAGPGLGSCSPGFVLMDPVWVPKLAAGTGAAIRFSLHHLV